MLTYTAIIIIIISEWRYIMKCPDMKNAEQSLTKGEQRIKKAVNALGTDVMAKICSVALYSLGYSYEYIAELSGCSKPGV